MDSFFKFVYRFLFLLPLLFLCSWVNPFSSYEWQTTDSGLKIWTDKGSAVKYHWDGDSRGGVIHGTGTLTISGGQKSSEKINAYYGTVNEKGLFNNEAYSQKYIGKFKKWPLSKTKEYDGFGVLVLKSGDVLISVFEHNFPMNNSETYIFKNDRLFYKGICENGCNGIITGKGTMYDPKNKDYYDKGFFENGVFVNGERHSKEYIGPIKNGKKNGPGREYLFNLIYFDGYFKDGTWNGDGVVTIPKEFGLGTEIKYAGTWKNGMLNGKGFFMSGQAAYDGDWVNNEKSGQGTMLYSDGSLYVGEWENNKKTNGKIKYSNGDIYIGKWQNEERNGEGMYEYNDGSLYKGDWKDDFQHGQGELKTSSYTYSGLWENGVFHGKGKICFENGDFYNGDFNEGRKEGNGTYQFKNGNIYKGNFKNDNFNGYGEFHFNSDKKGYEGIISFKGNFYDGKPKGHGSYSMQSAGSAKPEIIIESDNWNGMKLPDYGKYILPIENMMYEGPLLNGMPVDNKGKWSEYEKTHKVPDWLNNTSGFVKKHKETWNKINIIATGVLFVASFIPAVNSVALPTLVALSATDVALVGITSGVDCYGGDKEQCNAIAIETATEIALVAVPKIPGVKKAAKTVVKKTFNGVRKIWVRFKKNIQRTANKMMETAEDLKDKATESLGSLFRQFTKKGEQYIGKNFYMKNRAEYLKKAKKNLTGDKRNNSKILKDNMRALNKKVCSICGKGECQFHHALPVAVAECNSLLGSFGIDINDAINGICLPSSAGSLAHGPVHRGSHNDYSEVMKNACKNASDNIKSEKELFNFIDRTKKMLMKEQQTGKYIEKGLVPLREKNEFNNSILQDVFDKIDKLKKKINREMNNVNRELKPVFAN